MKQITRRERLHYQFDNTMSKGPIVLIAWLMIFSAFLIFSVTLVVFLTQLVPLSSCRQRMMTPIFT